MRFWDYEGLWLLVRITPLVSDNLLIPAVAFEGIKEFVIDVDMAMRVGGRPHAAHEPTVIRSLPRVPVCTFIKGRCCPFVLNINQNLPVPCYERIGLYT
jgi:hypothetical protein